MKLEITTAIMLIVTGITVVLIVGLQINNSITPTTHSSTISSTVSSGTPALKVAKKIQDKVSDDLSVDYHYADVAIDHELQEYIIDYCEPYNISPYLIMAMAEQESQCVADKVGDSGNSIGLLQVQPRWHKARMERLGVTDLKDPEQNVRVAVDYINELRNTNDDVAWVLMAYNGGIRYANSHYNSISQYAVAILNRSAELENTIE